MKHAICTAADEEGRLLPEAAESRKRWGCDKPKSEDAPLVSAEELETELPLLRCPHKEAIPRVGHLLPYLELAHERGFLPAGGALLDQTADFVTALVLYGKIRARVEHELAAERRQRESIKV
jgi:hypothetical protein